MDRSLHEIVIHYEKLQLVVRDIYQALNNIAEESGTVDGLEIAFVDDTISAFVKTSKGERLFELDINEIYKYITDNEVEAPEYKNTIIKLLMDKIDDDAYNNVGK